MTHDTGVTSPNRAGWDNTVNGSRAHRRFDHHGTAEAAATVVVTQWRAYAPRDCDAWASDNDYASSEISAAKFKVET